MEPDDLPACWHDALAPEFDQPWFADLREFVAAERSAHTVFPPKADVFSAFQLTPLERVKVLILGQDPYHDVGQAHGLSFSVRHGIKIPPSLRNIYKELAADVGVDTPAHGCLEAWAEQGVLLLNTVLTVRAHEANSHRKRGWERFTDRVIDCVSERPSVAFVLWGKPAQKKIPLIDARHLIIESPHPSPLSARRGFFGSKPFSRINAFLTEHGSEPIDWDMPGS